MSVRSSQAPSNTISRFRTYGLFGGAALGGVVGVLVSGPNFFVWSPAQSIGIIAGLAIGAATIGYLFVGLAAGGLAGSEASAGGHGGTSGFVDGVGSADGADCTGGSD